MFLEPRDTCDLISLVSFTFTMRRYLIRLASAPFTSSRLESWVVLRLLCATLGNEAERKIYGGWVKSLVLF